MTNPLQSLNENFMYNSLLARSLVQLMPATARPSLRLWLQKLHEIDGDIDVLKIRNEYMWFLLISLQNKKISQPFLTDPPQGNLQELKNILPDEIYEDILLSTDENVSWLDKVASNKSGQLTPSSSIPATPPSMFLDVQPKPKNGLTCYIAAFSDHS